MIITVECPACHTTFPVDPRKVPDGGVKVRCSACSGIFFVAKPELPPPAPAVPESQPVAEEGAVAAPPEPEEPEFGEPEFEEPRAHVDPWSGAGADEHPGEAGTAHETADPWSGGMGLHGGDETAFEAEESEGFDEAAVAVDAAAEEAQDEAEDEADDWVVERADPADLELEDEPVTRLDTVEEETRAAAEQFEGEEAEDEASADAWDAEATPPAAEAPVSWDAAEEAGWPVEEEAGGSPEAAAEEVLAEAEEVHAGEPADDDVEWEAEEAVGGADREEAVVGEAAEHVEAAIEDARVEAESESAAAEEAAPEPEIEAPSSVTFEARTVGFQFGKRDPHEKARRLARVLVSDIITYNPERHQRALEQGSLHSDFEEEIRKSWAEYVEQVGREMAEGTSYWFDALNEILARGETIF